jgi:predicted nucleotidyltransferase
LYNLAMSIPQEAQDKIQEMVHRIVENFHPEKVVLFGSYARGTAGVDSDVDLLVVMPLEKSNRETCVEIRGVLHGFGLAKDIIVTTPSEWESYRDIAGSLIRTAHEEGKTLYDRAA